MKHKYEVGDKVMLYYKPADDIVMGEVDHAFVDIAGKNAYGVRLVNINADRYQLHEEEISHKYE